MRSVRKQWILIVLGALSLDGCAAYRSREFLPVADLPVFESWTIKPEIYAYRNSSGANPAEDNSFAVSVGATTFVPGKGNGSYLSTVYQARIDQLTLSSIEPQFKTPIELGALTRGYEFANDYTFMRAEETVELPPELDRLIVDVDVTFVHVQTQERQVKHFEIELKRQESSSVGPTLD